MTKPAGKVKLTKAMTVVLRLMHTGWELGASVTLRGGPPWLQNGGIGHGGEHRDVSRRTVNALWDRKLIVQHYRFPTATYSFTALGHRVLKESSK